MPGIWDHLADQLSTREGQIGAGATIVLAVMVWRFGKPWFAALVLTAILIALETKAGTAPVLLVLHGIVILILTGSIFWVIRRSGNFMLSLILGVAAAGILLSLK
jgi:hypothetical protein